MTKKRKSVEGADTVAPDVIDARPFADATHCPVCGQPLAPATGLCRLEPDAHAPADEESE